MTLAGAILLLVVGLVLLAITSGVLHIIGIVMAVVGLIGIIFALIGHGTHGPRV